MLHRGQLLAHGTTDSLRTRLGFERVTEIVLDRAIDEELLQAMTILEHVESEGLHRYVIESAQHDLLEVLVAKNHNISTWRVVPPTLIELLCAATGMDRETIGMDVEQSSMLPFRTVGGEEE